MDPDTRHDAPILTQTIDGVIFQIDEAGLPLWTCATATRHGW